MIGNTEGKLRVLLNSDGIESTLWSRSQTGGLHYELAQIDLNTSDISDAVKNLVFEVEAGGEESDVFIDSIDILQEICHEDQANGFAYHCDLEAEEAECGLENVQGEGMLEWKRVTGKDPDHTYQSKIGQHIPCLVANHLCLIRANFRSLLYRGPLSSQ